jgi:hypothetical protein
MPIRKTDAISGNIYVIAAEAEEAQRRAVDYLIDSSNDYRVYQEHAEADRSLHNRYNSVSGDDDLVYRVTVDVRPADDHPSLLSGPPANP